MAEYLFNLGIIFIFYISQRSVNSGVKQSIFVLPFLLAMLLWSRQTRPKNRSRPFYWFMAALCPKPAICQHSSSQSVHSSFTTVGFFKCRCVLQCSSSLMSTVASGQSLGIGKRKVGRVVGWCHKHCSPE